MKKYFPEGLVQVAIVLSLLRTDLNEYFNNIVNDYSLEGTGAHQVILGSGTTAYAQTDLYGNIGFSDLSTSVHPKHVDNYVRSVFRELHSLGGYSSFANTNIDAYLLGESTSSQSQAEINESDVANDDENPVAVIEPAHNNSSGNETVTTRHLPVASDLTEEDMDLIEILWRQDIDLGVSKESFDTSTQNEKQKNETSLSKSKGQQKSEESPPDETISVPNETTSSDGVTFTIDMETGEHVPSHPPVTTNDLNLDPMEEDFDQDSDPGNHDLLHISFDDALNILEAGESNHSNTEGFRSDNENTEQSFPPMSGLSFSRQSSLEARWSDVSRLIIGEAVSSAIVSTIVASPRIVKANDSMDTSVTDGSTATDHDDVLFHNATLGTLAVQDNSFSMMQSLGESSNILPLNLNDSQPLFSTNTSDDVLSSLFPNATGVEPDENLLDDLLSEINDLEDDTELLTIKLEDADSAVGSWGSIGSASSLQDYGDSHSELTSPFDGLEGATGGHEDTETKYNPTEHSYTFSTIEWASQRQQHTNHSYSNDSSSELGYTLADKHKVNHDHSYPLKPGQEPRENKRLQKEEDRKIARTRDQRKAKAMRIPISIDDIIHTPVEKFNDLLAKYRLSDSQMQLIKDIRRRGKNKVAAQNCRKRKMEVIETLEESVLRMRQEKILLCRQRTSFERERNQIREKYNGLYRDVFRTLRDENGRPYNPSEYTLQHTPDGNVFLVPKNSTSGDDQEFKDMKKRKGRRK